MSWPQIHHRPQTTPAWKDVPPLLARLLAARGADADSLDFSLAQLPSPTGLVPDEAIKLLQNCRASNSRILVVADYDADGATACSVMVKGLKLLGFNQVEFLVPDRFVYGYGLTPAIVEEGLSYKPDLIVTVDNGISSVEGVAAARQAGIDVLVTDHHLPGKTLPQDCVIVNPRLCPDFAAAELAGVGVAFYVLLALRAAMRQQGDPAANTNLAQLLDLVALGTVADVVVLDHCNRILVEQGLRRMRAGQCSAGIAALAKLAKREMTRLKAADLGFAVGPRLNAAGRLADMRHGIECLLAGDAVMATQLAEELDAINRDRRHIETDMLGVAHEQLAKLRQQGPLPTILCLYSPDWHEGVVGLLASRVKELCHRPVVAFANSQESGFLKGSCRSIKGLHIRDALAELAANQPGLLSKFGGHAMAAGLSLSVDKLDEFRDGLQSIVSRQLTQDDLTARVTLDGELAENELTLANAELLDFGMPWGQGFPAPLFHGQFEVLNHRIVGEKHVKLTLGLPSTNGVLDGICFNVDRAVWPIANLTQIEGIYRLESNAFRGQVNPQLLFEEIRPVQT